MTGPEGAACGVILGGQLTNMQNHNYQSIGCQELISVGAFLPGYCPGWRTGSRGAGLSPLLELSADWRPALPCLAPWAKVYRRFAAYPARLLPASFADASVTGSQPEKRYRRQPPRSTGSAGPVDGKRRAQREQGRTGATGRPLWERCNCLPGCWSEGAAPAGTQRHVPSASAASRTDAIVHLHQGRVLPAEH